MEKKAAAVYLRLSKEEQGKAVSESILNQRKIIEEYLDRSRDCKELPRLYFTDDGYSGENFERPAVKEMLHKIEKKEISHVLVKDISRFGRNYVETGNYLERVFPSLGVRFISVLDQYDSFQAGRDGFFLPYQLLFNDMYCRDMSAKVKDSFYQKQLKGEGTGGVAPYGYKRQGDGRLTINPTEAEIIQKIFEEYAGGKSGAEIARTLTKDKIQTPYQARRDPGEKKSGNWNGGMVIRILSNELYLGKQIIRKRKRPIISCSYSMLRPEEEWITGKIPAVISSGLFRTVQLKRRRGKEGGGIEGGQTAGKIQGGIFVGKVICACCGHSMTYYRQGGIYRCRQYTFSPHMGSSAKIREVQLKQIIKNAMLRQISQRKTAESIEASLERAKKIKIENQKKTMRVMERKKRNMERRHRELYEAYQRGDLSREDYLYAKSALLQKEELLMQGKPEGTMDQGEEHMEGKEFFLEFETEILKICIKEIRFLGDRQLDILFAYQNPITF